MLAHDRLNDSKLEHFVVHVIDCPATFLTPIIHALVLQHKFSLTVESSHYTRWNETVNHYISDKFLIQLSKLDHCHQTPHFSEAK